MADKSGYQFYQLEDKDFNLIVILIILIKLIKKMLISKGLFAHLQSWFIVFIKCFKRITVNDSLDIAVNH